jgi:hypothetical protein
VSGGIHEIFHEAQVRALKDIGIATPVRESQSVHPRREKRQRARISLIRRPYLAATSTWTDSILPFPDAMPVDRAFV